MLLNAGTHPAFAVAGPQIQRPAEKPEKGPNALFNPYLPSAKPKVTRLKLVLSEESSREPPRSEPQTSDTLQATPVQATPTVDTLTSMEVDAPSLTPSQPSNILNTQVADDLVNTPELTLYPVDHTIVWLDGPSCYQTLTVTFEVTSGQSRAAQRWYNRHQEFE
jgi:hypothetical protein